MYVYVSDKFYIIQNLARFVCYSIIPLLLLGFGFSLDAVEGSPNVPIQVCVVCVSHPLALTSLVGLFLVVDVHVVIVSVLVTACV